MTKPPLTASRTYRDAAAISGRPIGILDAEIAAIALAAGARLATRNVSDFEGVGLDLRNELDLSVKLPKSAPGSAV